MPAKYGRWSFTVKNSGKLWNKDAKGQGFGSLYGGNQISNVSKNLEDNTVSESRESEFPK